jgi:uncharacterized protein
VRRVDPRELSIDAGEGSGRVSALLLRPPQSRLLYLFAHGAGAGMRHRFLERACARLASRGIATLRYQFPYTEAGRKRPDRPAALEQTVRAAAAAAAAEAGDLPLYAGGKSMGGRMTSRAQAAEPLPGVRGLVFFGFPLHRPGAPDTARGEHLDQVDLPMLFLQGTRDALADLALVRALCHRLGERATLHVVEGGDHSFSVLKRSGRTAEEVEEELAGAFARFAERHGAALPAAGAVR